VDHDNNDFAVFESGSIMMYLADKAGKMYPTDWNKRSEVNQWLFFMNAGVGPMQGQANHFVRFAPVQLEYPQKRYVTETYRLYSVLEDRLTDHEWLAADEYTIAGLHFCSPLQVACTASGVRRECAQPVFKLPSWCGCGIRT
jgi:glutathione S-transferase